MIDRHLAGFLGIVAVIAFAPRGAEAQIVCLPLDGMPSYAFEKVLDAAEAFPTGLVPNDRGHALIRATPAGTSGNCLLVHRGATTEPVACSRDIDGASPFTVIGSSDWNERGTIAVHGRLHESVPGSSNSHIQVIETDGNVFALPTFSGQMPAPKSRPAISGEGNVFYLNDATGSLQRFDPTVAGNDKSVTIVDGATLPIDGVEPAGQGRLYFNASGKRVGMIQNALGPASPSLTTFVVDDAFSPAAFGLPTPSRFGAFVYSSATEIRRRLDVGGFDIVVGDPEFVIGLSSHEEPIFTSEATLAGPCRVALLGMAQGLCTGGPRDGLACDPDEYPDPCIGGGGFCQEDVDGIFVHQAGSYAVVARVGDAMLGSVVENFRGPFGPEIFRGSNAGHIFFGAHLADGRDVIVRTEPAGGAFSPAQPASCVGLSCRFGLAPAVWLGVGPNGVPLYFDPYVATGYDYTLDPGDPRFASVMVPEPLPNGDGTFTLIVGAASVPLAAGEQVDLTQFDPLGVATFSIRGIDPGEELDPEDPMAFVTGVTFMEERAGNVTMTAVVPEPGAAAAGAAMVLALVSLARRRSGSLPNG